MKETQKPNHNFTDPRGGKWELKFSGWGPSTLKVDDGKHDDPILVIKGAYIAYSLDEYGEYIKDGRCGYVSKMLPEVSPAFVLEFEEQRMFDKIVALVEDWEPVLV